MSLFLPFVKLICPPFNRWGEGVVPLSLLGSPKGCSAKGPGVRVSIDIIL
jgi:hypothetical protein